MASPVLHPSASSSSPPPLNLFANLAQRCHPLIIQYALHFLLPLFACLSLSSSTAKHALFLLLHRLHHHHHLTYSHILLLSCTVIAACLLLLRRRSRLCPVYLLDFACYRPYDDRKVSKQFFIDNSSSLGLFTLESLDFQRKILERSGLGQETYFPPAVTNLPPNPCLLEACMEAETVMFGAIDELFTKTNIHPRQISVLVVNCSAFCPSPSLAAMIINKYKLRGNVAAYNLAGMGCSAGVIAADMAKWLLSVHPSTYALVVSTENITLNWYRGNDKNMLVSNCLFRMGGSALLLSNKRSEKKNAKFQLLHAVRTHKAADDKCFYCVQQEEDAKGILGVILSKELMSVAGGALRTNITTLGPLVLPYSELLKFISSLFGKHVLKVSMKPYTPNFMKAFEHFCVHAGGRAVLDEVEKSLGLTAAHMEPNRMTLHRFGNTSSSSLWYELAYLEAKGRIRAADRIWQIGFGSGFKCNSAVWRALRDIPAEAVQNCWSSFIDSYPVHIAAVDRLEAPQCA